MSRQLTLIAFVIIIQCITATTAMALSNSRMINKYRAEMPETIQEYISIWVENGTQSDYREPLTDILRISSNLMAYGIDIHDDILVAHLFEDQGKPVSMQVFAARLFFKQLKQETGWRPDMGKILHDKKYRVKARNINNPLAEDEFNLILP